MVFDNKFKLIQLYLIFHEEDFVVVDFVMGHFVQEWSASKPILLVQSKELVCIYLVLGCIVAVARAICTLRA